MGLAEAVLGIGGADNRAANSRAEATLWAWVAIAEWVGWGAEAVEASGKAEVALGSGSLRPSLFSPANGAVFPFSGFAASGRVFVVSSVIGTTNGGGDEACVEGEGAVRLATESDTGGIGGGDSMAAAVMGRRARPKGRLAGLKDGSAGTG